MSSETKAGSGSLSAYLASLKKDNGFCLCAECAPKSRGLGVNDDYSVLKAEKNKLICERCKHEYVFESE